MKEETKERLGIIGFIVIVLGTIWLLSYANHIIPDVVQPEGSVGIFQPKPYYYLPTMITIFFGGIFLLSKIILNRDWDEDWGIFGIFFSLLFIAGSWILTFLWHWDVGNHWYTIPLKITTLVGIIIGIIITTILILDWESKHG